MAAKTLEEFFREYRDGFNPITGERNLFKDLTDQDVWDAATKAAEAKFTSANKQSKPCRVCGSKFTKQVLVDECESCGALK